jgi:hypothetical protein
MASMTPAHAPVKTPPAIRRFIVAPSSKKLISSGIRPSETKRKHEQEVFEKITTIYYA